MSKTAITTQKAHSIIFILLTPSPQRGRPKRSPQWIPRGRRNRIRSRWKRRLVPLDLIHISWHRGFKSLKQMVKICFSLGDTENALKYYKELLTYTTRAVTRNYSEKSINNILDKISLSSNTAFMERFYNITLTALEEQQNERLWLKTNLKLAKLWLDRQEYGRLNKILRLLHKACQNEEGEDDQSKGTHLLEVYAIEIQMYTETKNNKKLKVVPKVCVLTIGIV